MLATTRGSLIPRLVVAAAACLALAGCAGQSAPTAPPPVSTPAAAASTPRAATATLSAPTASTVPLSPTLCAAAAQYQVAANALLGLDATKVGTDGVKLALQNLAAAAEALTSAARDQFGPQVAELEQAVAALRGTVAGLTDQDSLSTNLGKIAVSVSGVEQAAQPIVDSVRSGCPAVPSAEVLPTS